MSKESYIGGDYIETTGGSSQTFAKGKIINASLEGNFSQNGLKNGILNGINKPAPIISIDTDFYVDFYRDQSQMPDNFGKKDTEYKGTFGFDRYNEVTSGKGKQATSDFEIIYVNGTKCFVPWLSLWPPKRNLQSITEIDSSYTPVNSAKITLKVLAGKTLKGKDVKMHISSNHPNLKIDGNNSITKQTTINSTLEITVSCEGILDKDSLIEVKQNDKHGIVVGKLKVIKNSTIYIANTKFITVMEEEKSSNNTNKQQKREAEKTQFQNLIKDVIVYLNTNSLNQSLIYIKGTVEDLFVIQKGNINRSGSAADYSSSVTTPYFEGNGSIETKEERDLDLSIKALYNILEKNYKKNRKNTYFCEDTIIQTNPQLFKNYQEKYQTYLDNINAGQQGGREKRNDTLYVFIDKQQETLPIADMEYYGYTFGARNSAFIFNKHIKERKFGTFAHEIAHSLGLDHTFELNDKNYEGNKQLDKKIKEKENLINGKSGQQQISSDMSSIHNKFDAFMKDLDNLTHIEKMKTYKRDFQKKGYYKEINIRLNYIENSADYEKETKEDKKAQTLIVDVNQNLQKEISELKTKKENNKNLFIDVKISETEENFMDYDYDSSSVTNQNFEPKSFWKWQWDSLQNSKFLIKKEL